MKPDVEAFFDTNTNTVTYVVSDPAAKVCAVIDPVLDFDAAAARGDRFRPGEGFQM
mgnify:CR=1 FL=1